MMISFKMRHSYLEYCLFLLVIILLVHNLQILPQSASMESRSIQFDVLINEMMTAFQNGGESNLKEWVTLNKNSISIDFIYLIANSSFNLKSDDLFRISKIVAIESENIKGQAIVSLFNGRHLRDKSDELNALKLFEESEALFSQVNDSLGLGEVYVELGQIFFYKGDLIKSLGIYKKAMSYFKNEHAPIGQGNACLGMGLIYKLLGEKTNALNMFKEALRFYNEGNDETGQGNAYNALGNLHFSMYENGIALKYYEKALICFQKTQSTLNQGNVYEGLGKLYIQINDKEKSLAMYEKAKKKFTECENILGLGNVALGEGNIFAQTGETEKAKSKYNEALSYYEKARNPIGQGNVAKRLGDLYLKTGDLSISLEIYKIALSIFEEIALPSSQGNMLFSIGNIYSFQSDYSNANKMYENALQLFEKAQDLIGQGNIYNAIGKINLYSGEISKALPYFQKALGLFNKSNDQIGQGNSMFYMGMAYALSDDELNAYYWLDRAQEIYEKINNISGLANILKSKGSMHLSHGNVKKAFLMFEKALPFYIKNEDFVGLSNLAINYGELFLEVNNNEEALKQFKNALNGFKKTQNKLGQGEAYIYIGTTLNAIGRPHDSVEMFENALQIFNEIKEPNGQGTALRKLGEYFQLVKDEKKAINYYDQSISVFLSIDSSPDLALLFYHKASILNNQGEITQASECYATAIQYFEKAREQSFFPEFKRAFSKGTYKYYEKAALFFVERDLISRSFNVIESIKARLFLDQLVENKLKVDKGLSPELQDQQEVLIEKLTVLTRRIEDVHNLQELIGLKNDRERIQIEYDDLQMQIRLRNPVYASIRYPKPINVDELQQKVLKPGEVLVEYFLSDEKAFVFIATKSTFKTIELLAGSKLIRSSINKYLDRIGKIKLESMAKEMRISIGLTLYNQLVKPIESSIQEGKLIIFVPDGALAKLPFESLVVAIDPVSKEPVYLLEKYPVKYIQSASVLAFMRTQFKQEGVTDSFVGFGDPIYDYENYKRNKTEKGSTRINKGETIAELNKARFKQGVGILNRLEGSGREVLEIAKLFKGQSKTNLRLRLDATEEFAKASSMADYGYVHFSCHGILGDGFQCLALSQIPEAKEDGLFTLNECMNSSYNAKLVVLSACQTGRGIEERGEGVTGLTRAVMYAGSPAAVVSLWSVSDQVTKDLMVSFYRKMIVDGLPKSVALRAAKLDILKSKASFRISEKTDISIGHPFFWAAFVMYGE